MSKTVLKSKRVVWRAWRNAFSYYQTIITMPIGKHASHELEQIMHSREMIGLGISVSRDNKWLFKKGPNGIVDCRYPTEWYLFQLAYMRMLYIIRTAQKRPFDFDDQKRDLARSFLAILDFQTQRLMNDGKFSEAERLRDWMREAFGLIAICGSDKKAADFYKLVHEEEIKRQKEAGKALHDLRQRNKAAKEAEAKRAAEEAERKKAAEERKKNAAAKRASAKEDAAKKPAAKKGATKRQKKT